MHNGLYSIHVGLMDGRTGRGSGVVVFRDGHIRGGDAYLYYTGSYVVQEKAGMFRGEVLVNQHTHSPNVNPLFGGGEVSIGVSGTFTDTGGSMTGVALVGKQSLTFQVSLRKLAETD